MAAWPGRFNVIRGTEKKTFRFKKGEHEELLIFDSRALFRNKPTHPASIVLNKKFSLESFRRSLACFFSTYNSAHIPYININNCAHIHSVFLVLFFSLLPLSACRKPLRRRRCRRGARHGGCAGRRVAGGNSAAGLAAGRMGKQWMYIYIYILYIHIHTLIHIPSPSETVFFSGVRGKTEF